MTKDAFRPRGSFSGRGTTARNLFRVYGAPYAMFRLAHWWIRRRRDCVQDSADEGTSGIGCIGGLALFLVESFFTVLLACLFNAIAEVLGLGLLPTNIRGVERAWG